MDFLRAGAKDFGGGIPSTTLGEKDDGKNMENVL